MTRWLAAVALVAAVGLARPAGAQSGCGFVLGFRALRELVGAQVVGACLDDQRFAPNGNAEQRTTGGLLVWRKADNWTAFTDGYRTWINGPNGLQDRLNSERFEWEAEVPAAASPPSPLPAATVTPRPVPTAPIATPTRTAQQTDDLTRAAHLLFLAALADGVDNGGALFKALDPVSAEVKLGVTFETLPADTWAVFRMPTGIALNRGLIGYPDELVAAVFTHELQHAADYAARGPATTPSECLSREIRAFTTQAALWRGPNFGFRSGLVGIGGSRSTTWTQTSLFRELDMIADGVFRNPTGVVEALRAAYQDQCG